MVETLTLQKTNMVLFNEEQFFKILDDLNVKKVEIDSEINESGIKDFKIYGSQEDLEQKKQAACECCKTPITFMNLGHIAKGSKQFYCKNPSCFSHFIADKKLR